MVEYFNKSTLFFLFLLAQSGLACSDSQDAFFRQFFNQLLPHATVGFALKSCTSSNTLISYNTKAYLTPGSVSKLFTAVAALKMLPPEYRFQTNVLEKGNHLYFKFSGDPSFRYDDLEHMVMKLKQNKTFIIKGNIYIDNSRYLSPNYPEGANYKDFGWYYNAPISAVIINRNALIYKFNTTKSGDISIRAHAPMLSKYVHLKHNLKIQNNSDFPCQTYTSSDKKTNTVVLYGCLKQMKSAYNAYIAIPNPELYVSELLKSMLVKHGIRLKGDIHIGRTPKKAKILITHSSKPLHDLLLTMIQSSNMIYAGSFTKLLGLKMTGKGRFDTGAYAINKTIAKLLNRSSSEFHFHDGMGFRFNLVTSEQVLALLNKIFQDKTLFNVIIKILPVSGKRGTLGQRMRGNMTGIIYAKTGTAINTSALSGFINPYTNDCKIFSIITNNVTIPYLEVKNIEDALISLIYQDYTQYKK